MSLGFKRLMFDPVLERFIAFAALRKYLLPSSSWLS